MGRSVDEVRNEKVCEVKAKGASRSGIDRKVRKGQDNSLDDRAESASKRNTVDMNEPAREDIPLNLYRVSSPGLARVSSNVRLTPEGSEDVRHVVLDLSGLDYRFVEGQSLGVLTPGTDEQGRPNKLRLYSIASTRLGDDGKGNSAALCVKRVIFSDPETGELRKGIASNYLCDLKPGDEVSVTGPSGKTFLLPQDPASNLILVATGTGIAPFRAFLRRIYLESPGWTGQVYLFFGVRHASECLYRDELESFRDRAGYHFIPAFSREQTTADGKRMYVQHRMAERIEELWPLLQRPDTLMYVCGLKGMEAGIDEVFEPRALKDGASWSTVEEELRDEGRLLVETY